MILNSLNELYSRLADDHDYEIAKPGFSPQNISFRVVIKTDGSLFAIEDARIKDSKGKPRSARLLVIGKAKPPGSGINPCLLWDNMTYMLGYKKDDPKPERTLQSFEALRDKHLALEKEINSPSFSTVCRFLENWSPEQAHEYINEHPEVEETATGFGLFSIQGQAKPVNEHPEILKWWDSREIESDAPLGQCLITGESNIPIARLHPKIKSVAGAQSAGASLVSFNAPAYESYGKNQSFNAPVSEKAAFQYGTALNALLSGKQSAKHRIRIGDSTCLFWTDKKSIIEDTFGIFANEGSNAPEKAQDPELRSKVETFLKLLQIGGEPNNELGTNLTETSFYLLGLAPNAARLSVRFFHRSTVAELLNNLRSHHQDLAIVREWEETKGKRLEDPVFPAYWQLLSQTARVTDEIPPLLGGALMRAILQNTPYPEALLSAVIRRIRADRTINYLRAAIIKGVLTRNHQLTITTMLDTKNMNPAYLQGRLFAALEKIQEEGHREQTGRNLDNTIRDKYFSSASATPASIFPRLETLSTHHRRHLNPGRKTQFDQLIGEIKWKQSGTPKVQNMEQQGLFILGYYHQRKDFFTKKQTSPEAQTSN